MTVIVKKHKVTGKGDNMQNIRIKTRSGKMIDRRAEVIDRLDNEGNQYSIALVGRGIYRVIDRDFYGPVWSAK